jgi:hypothetical protein
VRLPRPRHLASLAALVVAVALPSATASAAPTMASGVASAYGMGALEAEWFADAPLGIGDLGLMSQNNIRMYRARFREDEVLSGGTFSNWGHLDNLTRQAALKDVTLTPVLMNLPGDVYTPPKTSGARSQFGSFAAAAARRYGTSGSFWASCGCPAHPMRVWEVWNEPNMSPYWDTPNAGEYASLLKAVRSKLRSVDGRTRIVFGGLAYASSYNTTTRLEPNAFLRGVIQATGQNSFDALAVHDYHSNATSGVNAIAGTVATLKQYAGTSSSGAPRQQVWINEFGKATALDNPATPSVDESVQSETPQRDWLNTFLNGVLAKRSEWNLGPAFWYAMRDDKNPNAAWLRLGLRRTTSDHQDAGPKLAWGAYTGRSGSAADLPLPAVR